MNDLHLHLIVNHAPLFGELAAAILLASGMVFRKHDLMTAESIIPRLFQRLSRQDTC